MTKIVVSLPRDNPRVARDVLAEMANKGVDYSYIIIIEDPPKKREITWKGEDIVIFTPQSKLEIVVADSDVEKVLTLVTKLAYLSHSEQILRASALATEVEYALQLRAEEMTQDSSPKGRWVKMAPCKAPVEAEDCKEKLDVVEIRH